jgi:CHAD domain-containing protein
VAQPREIRGLRCDESFRVAAGKVIWTRFDEMLSFAETALAGEDIEGVHDMRVASRRLRAALDSFEAVFPRKQLRPLLRDVKRLADALGDVRDLDVMLDHFASDRSGRPPSQQLVLIEIAEDLRRQRETARARLHSTFDDLEASDFRRRFLVLLAKETM